MRFDVFPNLTDFIKRYETLRSVHVGFILFDLFVSIHFPWAWIPPSAFKIRLKFCRMGVITDRTRVVEKRGNLVETRSPKLQTAANLNEICKRGDMQMSQSR